MRWDTRHSENDLLVDVAVESSTLFVAPHSHVFTSRATNQPLTHAAQSSDPIIMGWVHLSDLRELRWCVTNIMCSCTPIQVLSKAVHRKDILTLIELQQYTNRLTFLDTYFVCCPRWSQLRCWGCLFHLLWDTHCVWWVPSLHPHI